MEAAVGEELGDGEVVEIVPVGEAEEDAALLGNGDAGGLAVGEFGGHAEADGAEGGVGGDEKEDGQGEVPQWPVPGGGF